MVGSSGTVQSFDRLARLDHEVVVSGWIEPSEASALAAAGIGSIVNHRPDGEDPNQASTQAWEKAACAAGLRYRHVPVTGLPDQVAVCATEAAMAELASGEQLLIFCRSGMRSTAAWAMAKVGGGDDPQRVRDHALAAGYDLSRLPL